MEVLQAKDNDEIKQILIKCIGIKDLTQPAIKCLLDQDFEYYRPYWKLIEGFTQDRFKQEMRRFNSDVVKKEHIEEVFKLMIWILNAKLIWTKGKQGKNMDSKT